MITILGENQQIEVGHSGTICTVKKLLGGGTQGEVYLASYGQTPVALKWYYKNMAPREQRRILERLIAVKPPTSGRFLWPKILVEDEGIPGFGYIMPLKGDSYVSFLEYLRRKVVPSFRVLVTTCLELARSFYFLHAKGFCYRDINLGNVFFEPVYGDIRIGDTDNIVINGEETGTIMGTPLFMAPEIVRLEASANIHTDLYSLSVLLFLILFSSHPLQGKRESMIRVLTDEDIDRLYGYDPLFIFDPRDTSNAPDPRDNNDALIFWKLYPKFLKDLFTKAFTVGLDDPQDGRVKETEWIERLGKLRDLIFYCGRCKSENFFDPSLNNIKQGAEKLPHCHNQNCNSPLQRQFRLYLGRDVIMLNKDTKLFQYHIDPGNVLYPSSSETVGEVVRNPRDPSLWGIKNLSRSTWRATLGDKNISIGPNAAVPLRGNVKINFGQLIGEVKF